MLPIFKHASKTLMDECNEGAKTIAVNKQKSNKVDPELTKTLTAKACQIIPATVLTAFTAELSLKTLLDQKQNISVKGHDLKKLFEKVDTSTRTLIKNKTIDKLDISSDQFEDLINNNKNAFAETRYLHEKASHNMNIQFLEVFCESIMTEINMSL